MALAFPVQMRDEFFMNGSYRLIRPLLFCMDAERAHGLTLRALKTGFAPVQDQSAHPSLTATLWNRKFPNPIGLAAGFDKNAEVIGPAFRMGFGFVEAGTVTPRSQQGNPRPRIFRDPDHEAVINRMGFPNHGMEAFKANLERFMETRPRPAGVLGINIGMNKDQADPAKDYCLLVQNLATMADYLTINISSPNTPGLRDLQTKNAFIELMGRIRATRDYACGQYPTPLLVKFAPDLTEAQREELAEAALQSGIDGLILTNTTLDRPLSLDAGFAAERGGLSGKPLKDKATESIRAFHRLTKGRLPIIGLGGIASAEDAYEKIRAGASLVQVYTALVYQGPALVRRLQEGLARLLERDGFRSVADAIGSEPAKDSP